MRSRLTLLAAIALTASALALDTGNQMPAKTPSTAPANTPDPATIRQGGDTIADAVVIPAVPFVVVGATSGFTDDYDEVCPYSGSTSPDVVYSYTPPADALVDIDMLGSDYDTKIYVYDAELNLVACNDDFYPDYVSRLRQVPLTGGVVYYLVIDGWGGDAGDYVLTFTEHEPCVLECPPGGYPEGEPPLVDGYLDAHNGGCNSPEFSLPFQELLADENGDLTLCGVAGFYQYQGGSRRDTDWFIVYAGSTGYVEVTGDAELPTYFFELLQDCNVAAVVQNIEVGECEPGSMTMPPGANAPYEPGEPIWFWAGPTTFAAPDGSHPYMYDYVVHFSGLEQTPVAVETRSWTAIKSIFR